MKLLRELVARRNADRTQRKMDLILIIHILELL